jgi:hypothetical protein
MARISFELALLESVLLLDDEADTASSDEELDIDDEEPILVTIKLPFF